MNQLTTGKFISRKRKEKNLTQEQLAEKLGISNKTVSKWETGKCMPDYTVIKNLCEELEITMAGADSGQKKVKRLPLLRSLPPFSLSPQSLHLS